MKFYQLPEAAQEAILASTKHALSQSCVSVDDVINTYEHVLSHEYLAKKDEEAPE